MPVGLDRYCLQKNPFEAVKPRRQFRPSEQVRVAPVAAFNGLAELDAYIKRRKKDGVLAQVLVVGQNWTGKTSVARHVVRSYAAACDVDEANFLLPNLESINSSAMEFHQRWLNEIANEIGDLDLPEKLKADVEKMINTPAGNIVKTGLNNLLVRLAKELTKLKRAFGVYIDDDLPSKSKLTLVETAIQLFRKVATILVVTETLPSLNSRTEGLMRFEKLFEDEEAHIIRVEALTATDAAKLAEALWQKAPSLATCPQAQAEKCSVAALPASVCKRLNHCPFDKLNWEKDLEGTRLPITHLLKIMSFVINGKVDNAGDRCWPVDETLRISDSDLHDAYKAFKAFATPN